MTKTTAQLNRAVRASILALFAAAASVANAATTIYVNSKQADDSGSGESWETAKKSIQAGIDIAGTNDTVLVAAGTYQITSSLTIDNHIELRGATGNPADVVVDAQGLCPCLVSMTEKQIIVSSITFENGYSATETDVAGGITATDKSMVTNCIVKSCYHGVSGKDVYGGGIYLTTNKTNPENAAGNWPVARRYLPQVVDTVVKDCAVYAADDSVVRDALGGGVCLYYHNTVGLTVQSCAVTNFSKIGNSTSDLRKFAGGGAYLHCGSHTGDAFLGNSLEAADGSSAYIGLGAGVYITGAWRSDGNHIQANLSDSVASGNLSHACGAGVGLNNYATIYGCSVVSNRLSNGKSANVPIGGAGICVLGNDSQVVNTLVADNVSTNDANNVANAAAYAGAVHLNEALNTVIRDSVIRDNVLQHAGAISCLGAGGLLVSNCVMVGNVATDKVSCVRFYTNQQSAEGCGMSLIADCYIVSNEVRRSNNNNESVALLYYGSSANNRMAAPLKVRNCLFARNISKTTGSAKGWGILGKLGSGYTAVGDELLTFDHCTFAMNAQGGGSGKIFAGFDNETAAQYAYFKGCAFWKNTYGGSSCSVTTNSAHFANCYADVTNTAFVCTAENGNIGGKDAGDVKFVDADNLDFRLTSGSCLINKGGAFEEWMGDGRKNSVQDMGAGYVIGSLGKYGVTVGRLESKPRRSGSASDIGCSEFWFAPGFLLSVK